MPRWGRLAASTRLYLHLLRRLAAGKTSGAHPLGGLRASGGGDFQDLADGVARDALELRRGCVLGQQPLPELLVRAFVRLDVFAVDAHRLRIAALLAEVHEVLVDGVG